MILVDTHVLIWFVMDAAELTPRTDDRITAAAEASEVLVSPISFWEASMLMSKGRLESGKTAQQWTADVLAMPGFHVAPLTPDVAASAGSLPGDIHGDPADRMIVATARALGCPLLTADEKILAYAAAGHLRAEDARR